MPSRTQIAKRLADLNQISHKAVQEVPDLDQIGRDNLEVLAALVFAKMKGKSSVEEDSPGVLVVKNDVGTWKIVLKDEVLSLAGFRNAPNLVQFLAKAPPEKQHDSGFWIKIAETAIKLIERSYDKETKPPVKFQSPQSPGGEKDNLGIPSGSLAPANPESGDMEEPLSLEDSESGLPPDVDMGLGAAPPSTGQPGAPGVPVAPPGPVNPAPSPGAYPAQSASQPAPVPGTPPVNQGGF